MRCMVSFTFISGQQAAIAALIPREQAHVKELQAHGIIEALYLSNEDGGRGWIVMQGESKEAIEQALEAFPLHPYMVLHLAALR